MEDTKQKADELVFEFRLHANMWDCYNDAPNEDKNDIQCAIISTKNTIEVLEKHAKNIQEAKVVDVSYDMLQSILDEQTEILKELESRI